MQERNSHTTEEKAEMAFSRQAAVFDQLYGDDTIIQYKRKRVRQHVEQLLRPCSSILELNAGTGEDAVYFAKQGHIVHATDISPAMQEMLAEKVSKEKLGERISREVCSFTQLENLKHQGPYDMVFSNFAGLNCTAELGRVLDSLPFLVKPGGFVTLVILPKFCLWEFLLVFKGKIRTAFRRFSGKKGTKAHIEGEYFRCWYYNSSFVQHRLKYSFDLIGQEGLCTIVPPSYMQGFAEKRPGLYRFLKTKEDILKDKWPWKFIGDYYIISLRRKDL